MVYSPKVDNFETFQVVGLYKHFEDHIQGNLYITAMANGVRSRPAIFKKDKEQAQIMNLVIGIDEGKVDFLDWRNNCFDNQGCTPDDCKETSVKFEDFDYDEHNCLKSDCDEAAGRECDT